MYVLMANSIIQRLIGTCGLTSSNPLAVDEVQFLRALSLALHHHHTLAAFFVEVCVIVPSCVSI